MIQFTIDSFSGGILGRPYKSIKDAIQDGGYSVWCNEKIKKHSASGTARKRTLKGIAKTTFAKS